MTSYDAIVIGGGFYGARLSLVLREHGRSVLLLERERELLGRASIRNQARVHGGYHYPRSILTSLRSRANYARFVDEYGDCVYGLFTHYYAIARGASKVTASQFVEFCRRIGAPVSPAPESVCRLFDEARIESVFEVEECAFDAVRLRERLSRELSIAGVHVLESTPVTGVRGTGGGLRVQWKDGSAAGELVLNCTYSALNDVLVAAGATPIPIKRELTEMALVQVPDDLHGCGVTVMDGPFFSLMPYPARGALYTLSHVRYTPHASWSGGGATGVDGDRLLAIRRETRFPHMIRDAARFLPIIRQSRYVDSLWEIKALMPRSEQDDSRPILFRQCDELPGLYSVLGAKIDSVYDVEERLIEVITRGKADPSSPSLCSGSSG
jgi:glycine/D-amino acid oxidase-like deaminating enzyme